MATKKNAFELPKLQGWFELTDGADQKGADQEHQEFFDVKFCPWQTLDAPLFAAIGSKVVVLCKLSNQRGRGNPCEVYKIIRDDDDDVLNCACAWHRDPASGTPYICVAGKDAKMKIYNAVSGEFVRCLVGHGAGINELVTSPADNNIIASGSADMTVRIWSLAPDHAKQPCICILGGQCHASTILSVAFHDSGRFLLSAGWDHAINLWTIPDIPEEPILSPIEIYYSHFRTTEIHPNLVDCVAFYGDMILSKAFHDPAISLWIVNGFSSSAPPPPQSQAPTNRERTRSAFVRLATAESPAQYTRLIRFSIPDCNEIFFQRFRLHFVPNQNPVLAFCNTKGKVFFWDLSRFAAYQEYLNAVDDDERDVSTGPVKRPFWLRTGPKKQEGGGKTRDGSPGLEKTADEAPADEAPAGDVPANGEPAAGAMPAGAAPSGPDRNDELNEETPERWNSKYNIENPYKAVTAHKEEPGTKPKFVGRQVGWSPGGEWCVVVGSTGVLVLRRWH